MKRLQTWLSPYLRQRVNRHAWADELDFVGPRVRTASWSWVLLLAGVTAAAWLWPMVTQADSDMVQAQLDLKRLQRAVHQHAVAVKVEQVVQSKDPSRAGLNTESMRHAAELAQGLGYPWMRVLTQVEQAAQAEKTVMLAFSLDTSTLATAPDAQPEVRMAAAVRDDESALRWAQTLGSTAQLRGREKLGTPFTATAGAYEWRVEAAWSGETP